MSDRSKRVFLENHLYFYTKDQGKPEEEGSYQANPKGHQQIEAESSEGRKKLHLTVNKKINKKST